jgi:hypothetical protein
MAFENNVVLHDRRLSGNSPTLVAKKVFHIDATNNLQGVFQTIRSYGQTNGGIDDLVILCHGYAGGDSVGQRSADGGGLGLQLGSEDLTINNVDLCRILVGVVRNIFIYACAAADNSFSHGNPARDGQRLMGSIAIYANATVYAGDRIQWYYARPRIDFRTWEGRVWRFLPNGAPASVVANPQSHFLASF